MSKYSEDEYEMKFMVLKSEWSGFMSTLESLSDAEFKAFNKKATESER